MLRLKGPDYGQDTWHMWKIFLQLIPGLRNIPIHLEVLSNQRSGLINGRIIVHHIWSYDWMMTSYRIQAMTYYTNIPV